MPLQETEPVFGPGDPRFTRLAGSGTGSGRSRTWWNSENIAAFAPIPTASISTIMMDSAGRLTTWRSAKRKLFMSQCLDWLNVRGARRWQKDRDAGHGRQERDDQGEHHRVSCRYTVQQPADCRTRSEGCRDADSHSEDH